MKLIAKLTSVAIVLSFTLSSCIKDKCTTSRTYINYTPVYKTMSEVREMVKVEGPREISKAGKIFMLNTHLLINERGVGIHVYDYSNKKNPNAIAFIKVPGNVDMHYKNGKLYADNFIDLVVFDISDINNITEIGREINAFPDNVSVHEVAGNWLVDRTQGIAIDWIEEEIEVDCNDMGNWRGVDDVVFEGTIQTNSNDNTGGGQQTGKAGSMAAFSIIGDYLYVLNNGSIRLFSLANEIDPEFVNDVYAGFDIETIFPYSKNNTDYLFIGAQSGMHIFSNENPEAPEKVGYYGHINSCDPVVADDTIAFVTLRSGTRCQGFNNQLDVLDIDDLSKPSLIKTYEMTNPHGLGFDNGLLFICDGADGLKIYDCRETIDNIDQRKIAEFTGMNAYDVIPYNGTLLLSAEDGFYLYDYTSETNIVELSRIEASR